MDSQPAFPKFSELPRELREQIWRSAMPDRRFIKWNEPFESRAAEEREEIHNFRDPGILLACKESRADTIRFFTAVRVGCKIWLVNMRVDVMEFSALYNLEIHTSRDNVGVEVKRPRVLALHPHPVHSSRALCAWTFCDKKFEAVEEIVYVFNNATRYNLDYLRFIIEEYYKLGPYTSYENVASGGDGDPPLITFAYEEVDLPYPGLSHLRFLSPAELSQFDREAWWYEKTDMEKKITAV